MALSRGTRFGPYVIVSAVGAGGMGEVYRAEDTKLGRAVALKVLPEIFTADPAYLARFDREAKVLASLNHPNIAAIHGLEESGPTSAIVMELVEGPTLADRIAKRMPLHEALAIAKQIAEALEAAHAAGIIHRDLKPANIKVRPDGLVKVLDFGLAKALAPTSHDLPTLTARSGVIMGTPAYMSPEQARGEAADQQADIWSFGAVLYELLTGASPFGRATTADTLAAVLGTGPDYSVLPPDVPASARRLVRRCLEKDRHRRLKHAGDVRIDVEDALAALTAGAEPGLPPHSARSRRLGQAAAAIALAAIAGAAGWSIARRSPATPATVARLSIPSLEAPFFEPFGVRHLEISDDGSRVAYASASRLWIRGIDQNAGVAIKVGAFNPFFSPNGDWVGFLDPAGLYKVSALGGTPLPVATTSERSAGAAWGTDGTIVFATTEGLYQVSENGGTPRLVVKPDPARKERAYAWPRFMPDGRSVLFTILSEDSIDSAQIAVLDLKTAQTRIVLKGGTGARYVSPGRLVYASGQALKAIAFDPDTQQARADPVSLPQIEVATAPDNGAAEFAVSDTGTLVFITPNESGTGLRTLSWLDRRGKEEPLVLAPGRYQYPRISPDGTRVALDILGANRDIWIWNLQRPSLTRLTDGPTEDLVPVWQPDGKRVFFASDRTGNFDVYAQAADGASAAQVAFAGPGTQMPTSFTPDGTRLLVVENFKAIALLDLTRPGRLEPLLHDTVNHWLSEVSPDGKWIAYESQESGNQTEIFLRPFPDVSGRREKVSLDGGRYPHWGPAGSGELFYLDLNGDMMAASVALSPSLNLGRVVKLFHWEKPPRGISGRVYDVSPLDGRFLMIKSAAEGSAGSVNISVVLNWFQELRERVPAR